MSEQEGGEIYQRSFDGRTVLYRIVQCDNCGGGVEVPVGSPDSSLSFCSISCSEEYDD